MRNSLIIFLLLFMSTFMNAQKKAYLNGKIYTVNPDNPYAEVVITEGNKIIYAGSKSGAGSLLTGSIETIDLKGKLMLPGFIDDHVHFLMGGLRLVEINLRNAKSQDEFVKIIREHDANNGNKWITGGDWNHESWSIPELPRKEWIDEFTKDIPVFVRRLDGHIGLANSCALKISGITNKTPDPAGGIIDRDKETGEPTGILRDNAMDLVYNIIPEPTDSEYKLALQRSLDEAKKNGFTSIQDITGNKDVPLYRKFEEANKLTCRIYTRHMISEIEYLKSLLQEFGSGTEKIKIGALKAFSDGSLGASTAYFFEPYIGDPSNYGLPMDIVTDGRLKKWAYEAVKNNMQLCIHAIGDKANSLMLDMFEEVQKSNPGKDYRNRLEHAQHVQFRDIKRFKQLGIIASSQPIHLLDDGNWAEKRIGKERLKNTYALRSFLDENVKLCFGSDWPIASLNALEGIYAAVTRKTTGNMNPGGWIPEQKISVEEAVKCYTINNAYASFEENIKGSIEPGKLADFVILSEDIFSIPPEKIKDVKVEMTIFDGQIIFHL